MSTISTIDIPVNAAYVDFNCPSWCETDHIADKELDHSSTTEAVSTENGNTLADVWLEQRFEKSTGPVLTYGPTEVGVEVPGAGDLTVEQARELAALIVKLCDQAEGLL